MQAKTFKKIEEFLFAVKLHNEYNKKSYFRLFEAI
ncbi:hypothetical protein LMOSLCC2482_2128 [Listeria monocytogenes serotype 7 str. SLCC2482]|nr:hypothetical protein LMOf2365_2101 [Listeria monocytogenes serotype 4b str. F2365]ADB69018.1 hypothetical protein LM5578_2271 [Listeria monocytogenes 08-5578]ADB72063.1 hypothetical protein LM5923_2222 [Listeria monocytogenes 08-5923]AHF29918.1 hypothetical protein A407_2173 [Listeria monocytogenes serotype 4b str. 81-0861]AHF32936.1 hypothetical protein A430_2286 [Listeria monocytogenes serotype 1/2a str. 08-6569]AHF35927.1 hypothetical protein A431_2286 [Listeria monocytogenes serotype 1/